MSLLKALEGMTSELDLFSPPIVSTGILSADYVEYKPLQALGSGPIVFSIAGVGDRYIFKL
jgi:hypothetical protein